MRFPRYFIRVKHDIGRISAWGWSESSQSEAQQNAEARLQRILASLRRNAFDHGLQRYPYISDDVICEFVVDRVKNGLGQEIGVVSRNAYGALVLNVSNVLIIDIDIETKVRKPGLVARLFGKRAVSADEVEKAEWDNIRSWQRQNSGFSLRVYRTAAGLRAIVSNRLFPQIDSTVLAMMDALHGDSLYRQLCLSQKCFRARLTPKAWRIGLKPPKDRFPFDSVQAEAAFDSWLDKYVQRMKGYAVCRFVETIGDETIHPEVQPIVDLHDGMTCGDARLPLA